MANNMHHFPHYPHTLHASSSSSSRPRMPSDWRPHTVHASSPTNNFIAEEQEGCDSDEQSTPRASLAGLTTGLTILAEAASSRLSRDDTAADVSMLVPLEESDVHRPGDLLSPEEQLTIWSHEDRFSQVRTQRRTRRAPFGLTNSTYNTAAESSERGAVQSKTVSLGRRFSRSYKDKMSELRESVTKHAPLAGRIRRSSTPHAASDSSQFVPGEGCVNPAVLRPLSPSKRNARQCMDGRAKKVRPGLLGFSDRKDTPAPPPYGGSVHTLSSSRLPAHNAVLGHPGGDGARAAAARCNTIFSEDPWLTQQQEDLQKRRSRLGSLSSAADSGADLSRYGGSCNDSVQDLDEASADEMDVDGPPKDFDIVERLPYELSTLVFEYLDAPDLAKVARTKRLWHSLANENSAWRYAYLRKYERQIFTNPPPIQVGGIGVGRTAKQPYQPWKKMYEARVTLEKNWRMGAQDAGKAIYLSGHTDSVYCLQFDEEKIITGSRDRTIRVWDINTFQCLHVIGGPPHKPVIGPKVLRTVDYPAFHVATASVNGSAYGNGIYKVPADWHDASILCLQYDEEILVTGSSDTDLIIWDVKTYEPITRLKRHTGGVLDVALDAHHIISCSKDSKIIVWDRKTFAYKGELTGHRGPVNAVQLRGNLLVSASGDGIARLWDLKHMRLLKEFSAKERGLAAVEFSEDTKYVLAGGNDHITYKFETETGREVMQFTGHSQLVRSLWLDSANKRVVSGSYDLDLRVYDFETGEEIWRAEEWTTSWMLAAKSDYRRIVATSQDGRILIVDFGLQKGGYTDGQPIEGVELLRGIEKTNKIEFRNPWIPTEERRMRSDSPTGIRNALG